MSRYEMQCCDSDGFTDAITEGTVYAVLEFKNNSVLIVNDKGQERYYGEMHFRQCEYQD